MKRRFLIFAIAVAGMLSICIYAAGSGKKELKQQKMEEIARALPDSVFEDVKMEDLLDDEVYLKLAHDGWTAREISAIMNTALTDKAKARLKGGYGFYAKQWRPYYGRTLGDDSLYQYVDTTLTKKMIASIEATVPAYDLNTYWPKISYNPNDRKNGIRRPGYFRPVEFNPSSGRIHHIVVHPDNPDRLYVVADGCGIFKTDNCGDNWECITDRIPDRINRSLAGGYGVPVDPDNWDHVFAFMQNSSVYVTEDGGTSWRRVAGATHKDFKRGYCFKDAGGNLKFIGATMSSERMNNELWISEDSCKNWTKVNIPDNLKETNNAGVRGFWFQEIYFDGANRDRVLLPGSKSILCFDDGAQRNADGNYTLKKLTFNVFGQDGTTPIVSGVQEFPFPGDAPGHMAIDPSDPRKIWYALGKREGAKTALFYSADGGANWTTLHNDLPLDASGNLLTTRDSNGNEVAAAIGKGGLYGNESAWSWLGGFGVNFADPTKLYGCSMSSAKSVDGGKTWTEYAWGNRIKSRVRREDGSLTDEYYYVSASRHNADNHTIASHKSGRVFRGSDGGMFMIDPSINGGEWTNIGNNMGQMLFYDLRVNEFGDQAIIGNTQDIDVQTYRYGRWGNWRGYEGSEASFNPYSSTAYFSGGNGGGLDGMNPDSWHTARNFADVRTNSWYMLRTWNGNVSKSTLYRIDDIGNSMVDLYPGINARVTGFTMGRDKNRTTIYVTTSDGYFYRSIDGGNSFQPLIINNQTAKFSNTKLATDPNNTDIIYLGQNGGKVFKWDLSTGVWNTPMSTGLPSVNCDRLLFHEGSGDLYFVSYSNGIYILPKGETTWKFWTKGYNGNKFNDCDINYTTQEMVISDYGRGAWVADLEHPSDRYFSGGFSLKEYSNVNGRRTIGINTDWTIPLYYNYKWVVNDKEIDNPFQYLNYPLKAGDKVQLTLSLREAPDVVTVSDLFVVEDNATSPETIDPRQGNMMYSDGSGRIDLGYMDWFFKDFTVDLWVRPESDGVILANRQRESDPDRKGAKGWILYIEGGQLKFSYSPTNYFIQPTYEESQQQTFTISGGMIPSGQWSHVAVSQQRDGNIILYLNGNSTASAKREHPDHSLNNAVILSLFGDINERNTLKGSVDELKIWNKALPADEIRREMFSTNLPNSDGLVAYYNFNASALEEDSETFSKHVPRPRTRAEVEYRRMTVPVSANYADYHVASASRSAEDGDSESSSLKFAAGNTKLLDISNLSLANDTTLRSPIYVFGYDSERWDNEDDNLQRKYFEPSTTGYLIKIYGNYIPNTTADVTFHNGKTTFDTQRNYRLYTADNSLDRTYWKQYEATFKKGDGVLTLEGVPLQDIANKKLLIVAVNPALELSIEGLNAEGKMEIFEEDKDIYNLQVKTVENMHTPEDGYTLLSENSILVTPTSLSFDARGVASDNVRVDIDQLGEFNNTVETTIKGEDDRLIPVAVDVVNRITPKELGNSVSIASGGLTVGSGADFSSLYGTKELTMMGWVKIDDKSVLTNGRSGDGLVPLLFFRGNNGTATGIHLRQGGNMSFHWNDEANSYNTNSNLNFSDNELGKWTHVAMVVTPTTVNLYLNGTKYTRNYTTSACKVASPLMLGQNADGNKWFSGSFDQVAVWNRSLSDDEVRKYMQQRVLLNDEGLVSYITMDYSDEKGRLCDLVSGATIKEYGTVTHNTSSTTPFNPEAAANLRSNPYFTLSQPRDGVVTVFSGTPVNFLSPEHSATYYPLNREYYTQIYSAPGATTGTIDITYHHRSVQQGDKLALGIRQLGSTTPFEDFIQGEALQAGSITFSVPAARISKSAEMMVFLNTADQTGRRPLILSYDVSKGLQNGETLVLESNSDLKETLVINIESGNDGDKVLLTVDENYVTLPQEEFTINSAMGELQIPLTIIRENLNPFTVNPVTVKVTGADLEPFNFNISLQPRVRLSLKNGTAPGSFTATGAFPTLEIETELLQGYLDKDVVLKFSPETLSSSFSSSAGKLLQSDPVTITEFDYSPSEGQQKYDEGWNLIGNPYLSNINLTKQQNFSQANVTHYVYHTLPGIDNLIAYDMLDYKDEQQIIPFQAFFVQTMDNEASLAVKAAAKEQTLSRKTFDYYALEGVKVVELALICDGKEVDRTTIKWSADGNIEYKLNEDAPKLWSHNPEASSFYTLSEGILYSDPPAESETPRLEVNRKRAGTADDSENKPLSINVVGANTQHIDLKFNIDPSVSNVSVVAKRLDVDDQDIIYFNDMTLHQRVALQPDEEYAVEDPDHLHTISIEDTVSTQVDKPATDNSGYRVYTAPGECTVEGLRGNAEVAVFTISGMPVDRITTSSPSATFRLPADIYVVRVVENEKEFVAKIVVK